MSRTTRGPYEVNPRHPINAPMEFPPLASEVNTMNGDTTAPMVPVHIPDPPGQNITFRLIYVDARVGLPKPVAIGAMLPIPGTVGMYAPFVGVAATTLG